MSTVTHSSEQSAASQGASAALKSVRVDGQLNGLLLNLKARQHYENLSSDNLEVVYTIPLPWGATLLGLNAEVGDRHLHGAVFEKQIATERYEKAVEDGDMPIMVERSKSGLYTANLGNLKPGESAIIEVEFAQLLRFEQGQVRITLPTTVAPRFGDPHVTGGLAEHETVAASLTVEYPLTVKITVNGEMAKADFT